MHFYIYIQLIYTSEYAFCNFENLEQTGTSFSNHDLEPFRTGQPDKLLFPKNQKSSRVNIRACNVLLYNQQNLIMEMGAATHMKTNS